MQIIPDKKLLLHMCCGPCGIFPVKHLREKYPGYTVAGYFYNPNIHPYQEFLRRLEALKAFSETAALELIADEDYELEDFLTKVISSSKEEKKEDRCRVCYEIRLRNTACLAKKEGFDAFTTTLLVSPYQKHELIKEVAQKIAQEEGVEFFYLDFRPGWREGVSLSRELKLYRQPYCGCIFSEKERYYKKEG